MNWVSPCENMSSWHMRTVKSHISLHNRTVWTMLTVYRITRYCWTKKAALSESWLFAYASKKAFSHGAAQGSLVYEPRAAHDYYKMASAPCEDSDQPGHPPSLIRVFAVRIKRALVLSYPLSAQRRLWSDGANAKADQSLRWAHMPFCKFCHALAQLFGAQYGVGTSALAHLNSLLDISKQLKKSVA